MVDINEMLGRSFRKQVTTVEVYRARAESEAAGRGYDLAEIRDRQAELASQAFEYVAKGKLVEKWGELTDREREIGIAFSRYAVYGRTD